MKKTVSVVMCFLLSACTAYNEKPKLKVLSFEKIDSAPLEHIHVAPSRRAIEYGGLNFDRLARKIRKNLFDEGIDNYGGISLIMVDYTELPEQKPDPIFMRYPCSDPKYYADYNGKPARYYLNLKFYKCNEHPPCAPVSDITVTLSTDKAPPFGAFVTMVYEAVRDYATYDEKKLVVNLDY